MKRVQKYPWDENQLKEKNKDPLSGVDANILYRDTQDALYEYGNWHPARDKPENVVYPNDEEYLYNN